MTFTTRHVLFAALLGLLLGALAVASVRAASRSSAAVIPASEFRPVGTNPHGESDPQRTTEAPTILDPFPVSPPPERAAVAVPSPELRVVSKAPASEGHSLTGTASWGDGWTGVVTRLPRGTAICVAGPLGRWCGASVGYGPALWTGRIADLSRAVFGDICGPVSAGLCRVVLSW